MSEQQFTSITPTLVICVGKFGHEVGIQLAARLLLMEAGLRQEAPQSRLVARTDANKPKISGCIRLMKVDFKDWIDKNYDPEVFIQDLEELTDASVAERGTNPSPIDPVNWPPELYNARKEMNHWTLKQKLLEAVNLLRTHSMENGQQSYSAAVNFTVRVCVVCAAREKNSILTMQLIDLLGNLYVKNLKIAPSGIQVFCFVGGTSREEHLQAGNRLKDSYTDDLLKKEYLRVLGIVKKDNTESLLDSIEHRWQSDTIIDMCYLFDAQLANGLIPGRGLPSEPDEVIVAIALTIGTFIATNLDREIRSTLARRWNLSDAQADPGAFATVGVASYAIDHPKLHRLVHSWLMGDFLNRSRPPIFGDSIHSTQTQLQLEPEAAGREKQVQLETQELLEKYRLAISFERLSPLTANNQPLSQSIDINEIAARIAQCDPNARSAIQLQLSSITKEMTSAALLHRLQRYQQEYSKLFRDETVKCKDEQYNHHEAPLLRVFALLVGLRTLVKQEVSALKKPLQLAQATTQQQTFASDVSQEYSRQEVSSVDTIQKKLGKRPHWMGATGRVLLIIATASILFPLPLAAAFIIWLAVGLLLTTTIHGFARSQYKMTFHKEVTDLTQFCDVQFQQLNAQAWQWALVETEAHITALATHVEQHCQPGGTIAQLREKLLNEDIIIKERVLERLFLDKTLKDGLKEFVHQSEERHSFWRQRAQILPQLVETLTMTTPDSIEKVLRRRAENLYRGNNFLITDTISQLLATHNLHRLEGIYDTLADTAVLFLRHDTTGQEDPSIHLNTFSVHGTEAKSMNTTAKVLLVESIDKLRWTFLHVHAGFHFAREKIQFSISSLIDDASS